ncbi:MAG: helicase-related protein [Bacteroidota bacterium]|nr:helicase-related protein [Bacteroidota bacterium]
MGKALAYRPGDLVRARGREWVVLPELRPNLLKLRPMGGTDRDSTLIYLPLEPEPPKPATFSLPDPNQSGTLEATWLLMTACRLKLRAGAGPFRSFGHLNFEPRAYQLVPLMMALRIDTIRLLIADDVGIGKTIEAGLIARELLDRGEITKSAVICPPHLCDQWQQELETKFSIQADIVSAGTARRLERNVPAGESIFEVYDHTVVSLDYIKSNRRRDEFARVCPDFVIVDEAHTCVRAYDGSRHQRHELLIKLVESERGRHLVLLTATPHSGNDRAFHNLLGLLDSRFEELQDLNTQPERIHLREELSAHFVQRCRGDIAEWNDSAQFSVRESREATYRLTGQWGQLFWDVLKYARTMVAGAASGTHLEQRMSWWAALALMRCISSSPAAASMALRTRMEAVEGRAAAETLEKLEQTAVARVMDMEEDDFVTANELVPAGTIESEGASTQLSQLIATADSLRGPRTDPKLKLLIRQVRELIRDGFRPVIFCRYIATAHYVGENLERVLPATGTRVEVITGELTPQEREARVETFGDLDPDVTPVLVATDCLSEGINLQNYFDAVIHYALTWNPTRHEQREGRVDRFGQMNRTVRTVMIYGQDNPVDGAVLRVILRKAKQIRKELGVAIPIPSDSSAVVEAIMKTVLLRAGSTQQDQKELDFGEVESELDAGWERASTKISRTIFAQRRLRPKEVLNEWRKVVDILGGPEDVKRLLHVTARQLGTPMQGHKGTLRLPTVHLPPSLREQLTAIGVTENTRIAAEMPVPAGCIHVHRAHPLVAILADYVTEQGLEADGDFVRARSTAIFTSDVSVLTYLFLLRLRCHIHVRKQAGSQAHMSHKQLLAEECLTMVHESGNKSAQVLSALEVQEFMRITPSRNMHSGQKSLHIRQALDWYRNNGQILKRIAQGRGQELLQDHRRVRTASGIKGITYEVEPAFPMDVIGIAVLVPVTTD